MDHHLEKFCGRRIELGLTQPKWGASPMLQQKANLKIGRASQYPCHPKHF
jgi:hypothetical protein